MTNIEVHEIMECPSYQVYAMYVQKYQGTCLLDSNVMGSFVKTEISWNDLLWREIEP